MYAMWTRRASGLAAEFTWPPTPAGSPPENSWRTWPEAAKKANQPPREQDWSQSFQPLRLPRKSSRQRGSRRLRRPDPARRHRRSSSPASCRCPSAGADPVTKTPPRGGGDRGVTARAAATVGPTVDREGRSKAASAAAGAAGRYLNVKPYRRKKNVWD
jgi:hypothetical protein